MTCDNTVINLSWAAHQLAIAKIRRDVFIVEQGVPEELEWDEYDQSASHFGVIDSVNHEDLIAYGRLLPTGKLTRMAVALSHRRHGHGSALVNHALSLAKSRALLDVHLDAQLTAMPFYRKLGFKAFGNPFWDAGIEHMAMKKI